LLHVPNPKNASAARENLLVHPYVLSATPAGWDIPSKRKINLQFRPGVPDDEKAALLRQYDISAVSMQSRDSFVLVAEFTLELEKLAAKLLKSELVAAASVRQ
ncbi:MAG TPA: hypothetical protein PLL10_11225, partial [Elusimicrobiales bacterium]|nr:hypothetical protein [Elusimicrobiales bacterium]